MRARGLATVQHLAVRGLLTWEDGAPRPRGIPPELAQSVQEDRRTIEAVLRRAAVFSRQLATASLDPFVRFRDPKWTAEGCPSCGGPVGEHKLRCELCAVAVSLALDGTP
ncbi:MAG: hypothetical protein A3G35_10975 [candidate division NC10 bacterium RIFCSPLOWO2_12_FULL_66_18]|nr:MAG: hypothetical protein A3G35_10975 [candidate division NC10 bacterium RIFCSPLOWO2_12_FULL_66_18]